ncbi:uncharacterized protein BO66DRAFT_434308 [Aspergillus aculeatinus CBS 121060]|uniref:Uncharacterized protein n=1 Tax=Aspergillus aculeatinus CBS 121060 TaxID=1448322 RepID=A0ACD1HM25_9EURO|nr:hypothetical protein BO66DRAFT_434308 [Aspergillus aculeatinus CBS 121060]RAH74506.1 hypothetical protein BO66DRAFT_434308 [Aspergillus aculeatinus CBS 121060]
MRFHITVSAKYFQDDLKTTIQDLALLHKLDSQDAAVEQGDEEESVEGESMEEICFWIASKCNSVMKLLSSEERKPRVRTLQDWFDIQTLGLTLQTLNEKFHIQSSNAEFPRSKLEESYC